MYEIGKLANTIFKMFLKEVVYVNGISAVRSIARYTPQVRICIFIYSSSQALSQNVLMEKKYYGNHNT